MAGELHRRETEGTRFFDNHRDHQNHRRSLADRILNGVRRQGPLYQRDRGGVAERHNRFGGPQLERSADGNAGRADNCSDSRARRCARCARRTADGQVKRRREGRDELRPPQCSTARPSTGSLHGSHSRERRDALAEVEGRAIRRDHAGGRRSEAAGPGARDCGDSRSRAGLSGGRAGGSGDRDAQERSGFGDLPAARSRREQRGGGVRAGRPGGIGRRMSTAGRRICRMQRRPACASWPS